MIHDILKDKPTKLFLIITAFFCCNALIAETIGTKLFSLEKLFGYTPTPFSLFGESVTVTLTCGMPPFSACELKIQAGTLLSPGIKHAPR